jgi:hypothetical protein
MACVVYAAKSNCKEVLQADLTQSCNDHPCETFVLETSEWTPCSVDCGTGFQTREVKCVSSNGYNVPVSKCTDEAVKEAQICRMPCNAPFYVYSSWGACSEPCGDTGVMSRTATCYTNDRVPTTMAVCASIPPDPLMANCNRQACESFMWETGPWMACSNPNDPQARCGGSRKRSIICRCAFFLLYMKQ